MKNKIIEIQMSDVSEVKVTPWIEHYKYFLEQCAEALRPPADHTKQKHLIRMLDSWILFIHPEGREALRIHLQTLQSYIRTRSAFTQWCNQLLESWGNAVPLSIPVADDTPSVAVATPVHVPPQSVPVVRQSVAILRNAAQTSQTVQPNTTEVSDANGGAIRLKAGIKYIPTLEHNSTGTPASYRVAFSKQHGRALSRLSQSASMYRGRSTYA